MLRKIYRGKRLEVSSKAKKMSVTVKIVQDRRLASFREDINERESEAANMEGTGC